MPERGPIQDVNIELGDEISGMLYEASKLTHVNRPGLLVEMHESFSGFRAIPGSMLKDPENLYFNLGFDGVGTKIEVSERMDDHSVVAHDLFAMVCDDAVVRGAESIAIGSILDVRQLGDPEDPGSIEHAKNAIKQLGHGYVEAAKAAGVVVVNGEVAELGDRVGGYNGDGRYNLNYNWGAATLWIAHKDRILTGHQLRPGDSLIGLAEPGLRSNGMTDVRKAMFEGHGKDWHDQIEPSLGMVSLGRLVQRPSTIYSGFVTNLTGGGQPSKLGRLLEPSGLGVTIDEPIDPPEIMLHVQGLRGLSDRAAYGKWHMGPGMVLATPEPEAVLAEADIHGVAAKKIGQVTDHPGIRIKNRGAVQDEEWLFF